MPATLADIQVKYGDNMLPRYKGCEPYMESVTGHGYQGVLLYDTKNDLVMCNECGKKFQYLSNHVRSHNMTATEYKDKHGFYRKTPLVSKAISQRLSKTSSEVFKKRSENDPSLKDKLLNASRTGRLTYAKNAKLGLNNPRKKRQFQNGIAMCPDQITGRITDIKTQTGKSVINSGDLRKYDISLYDALRKNKGNVDELCKEYGLLKSRYSVGDHEIVAYLRNWVLKHKKIPSVSDMIQQHEYGFSLTKIQMVFGSWRKAKTMAGLDQLLREIQLDPHKGIPAHLIVGGRPAI